MNPMRYSVDELLSTSSSLPGLRYAWDRSKQGSVLRGLLLLRSMTDRLLFSTDSLLCLALGEHGLLRSLVEVYKGGRCRSKFSIDLICYGIPPICVLRPLHPFHV